MAIATEHSIPKSAKTDEQNGFAALREEGLKALQKMSGEIWTDYNLHDPGVTILEQLCYALTDLIERGGYSVEDVLTEDDGSIRYQEQALHLPEEILPCRPTTCDDICRLILSELYQKSKLSERSQINNVWLDTAELSHKKSCAGIYHATVSLAREVTKENFDSSKVKRAYASQRNLCEDIDDCIKVTETLDCFLHGKIEVDGTKNPSDVLAKVYQCASSYISDNARDSSTTRESKEMTLVERLTGPLTTINYELPGSEIERSNNVLLRDMIVIIQQIDSVVRVQELSISVPSLRDSPFRDSIERRRSNGKLLRLKVPQVNTAFSIDHQHISIIKSGRPLNVSMTEAVAKYEHLQFADRASRATLLDPSNLYALPQGQRQPFRHYYSVQNQFPDVYGINAFGVPSSAPMEVQISAKQLKAYLMLFEQILANHAANIDSVRVLFAKVDELGTTYQHQVLDNDVIAGAEELYDSPPDNFLKQTMAKFDQRAKHRSLQLDNMLAVFGESFTQDSLRHLDYYSSPINPVQDIAENKVAYLRNVVEVTRDRVGGRDYYSQDSVCGFSRRVGLLLGFEQVSDSLMTAVDEFEMQLCSAVPENTLKGISRENMESEFFTLPFLEHDPYKHKDAFDFAKTLLRKSKNGNRLLIDGTRYDLYRYQQDKQDNRFKLVLCSSVNESIYSLSNFASLHTAAQVASALKHLLSVICKRSEGMHLVEHVLLRPAMAKVSHCGRQPCQNGNDFWQEFYPNRFSAFFPDWTARCHSKRFRSLAEETIRINSPAHVFGQCYWLSPEQMRKFEKLQSEWRTAKQNGASPDCKDNCSVQLIDFITNLQKEQNETVK